MNEIFKIAMQADAGQVVRAFSIADTAGKKFGASLEALNFGARAIGQSFDNAANKIKSFGVKVVATTGGMVTSMGYAVKQAANLEQQVNNINSIMLKSRGTVQGWTDNLIALSRTGVQGISDLATGLYDVASAGFKGNEMFKILAQSQKAATAGLTSVATANQVLVGTINAYGAEVDDVRKISDILFQGVNVGIFTFEELAQNMGDIIPIAAQAKISLEEVTGAYAAVTRAGVLPAEGATSVARLIQGLIDPSEALLGTLKELGYESGAQALQVDGLYKVMMRLKRAGGENIETLLRWFPEIRAARGAMALLANQGKNYTDVMKNMDEATKGQGATQRALNEQMKSLNNRWALILNSLRAAMLNFGVALLPLVKFFTSFVEAGVDLLDILDRIPAPIKTALAGFTALGVILALIGGLILAFRAKSVLTAIAFNAMAAGLKSISPAARNAETSLGRLTARMEKATSARNLLLMGPLRTGQQILSFGAQGNFLTRLGGRLTNYAQSQGVAQGAVVNAAMAGQQVGFLSRITGAFRSNAAAASGAAAASANYGRSTSVIARAAGALGARLTTVGTAMGNFTSHIRNGIRRLVEIGKAMGGLITIAFAFGIAWSTSGRAAEERIAKLEDSVNPERPRSVLKGLESINKEWDALNKKADEKGSVGGFFRQLGKSVADIGANFISGGAWDPYKDSIFDLIRLKEKLEGAEKRAAERIINFQKNYSQIARETNNLGVGVGLDGAKNFDLMGSKAREFDNTAKLLGVDLSRAFNSDAAKAGRQAVIDHLNEASSAAQAFGKTLANVTEEDIAKMQELDKQLKQNADSIRSNLFGQLSLSQSYDPNKRETWERIDPNKKGGVTISKLKGNLIPAQQQIADYYQSIVDNTLTFVDDVNTAIEQGLDPNAVVAITLEGPASAGQALHQVVGDQTGALIDIMNSAYTVMGTLSERAVAYNRILTLATQDRSGQLYTNYRKAIAIQNEIYAQGGKATWATVANALAGTGMTEEDIRKINDQFNLGLKKALTFDLPEGWAQLIGGAFPPGGPGVAGPPSVASGALKKNFKKILQDEYQALLTLTKLTPEQGEIYMKLKIRGDKEGLTQFFKSLDEESRRQVLYFEAGFKEGPKLQMARMIENLNNIPQKGREILFDAVFGYNGQELNAETLNRLKLHYGLSDLQLQIVLTYAAEQGDAEAQKILDNWNEEIERVHYYKIEFDLQGGRKEQLTDYVNTLIDTSIGGSLKEIRLEGLKVLIDTDQWTRARAEVEELNRLGLLSNQEYKTLINLVVVEQNTAELKKFLTETAQLDDKQIETTLRLLQEPGALDDLNSLRQQLSFLDDHDFVSVLSLVGTEEAITAIAEFVNQLPPEQINTFLDSIDLGEADRKKVEEWIAKHNNEYARMYVIAIAETEAAERALQWVARNRSTQISATQVIKYRTESGTPIDPRNPIPHGGGGRVGAIGGLIRFFAQGGMSDQPHVAQLAKAGDWRIWSEPETGGEAYIPLSPGKRQRSTSILQEVAKQFGYALIPRTALAFASGGMMSYSNGSTSQSNVPSVVVQGGDIIIHGSADAATVKEIERKQTKANRELAREIRSRRGEVLI